MGTVKRQSRGLPLVDLFLVATLILLIIVAMAIPHVDRSRMAANQASAVGALRAIDTAETGYASPYHTGYSPTLAALGPPLSGNGTASAAGLIDSALASGSKWGYRFVYSATPDATGRNSTYSVNANPIVAGTTGVNYYYTDQTGVIRQNSTREASASDSPLGG